MAMVTLTIQPEGSEQFSEGLLARISGAKLSQPSRAKPSGGAITFPVQSHDHCDKAAAAVVEWVESTVADFTLHIEGPGADFDLRMLRTEHDREFISGLIASAAYLQ